MRRRTTLRGLVLLMDIRHPLKEFDCNMLDWAKNTGLAVHCVLTKSDKLNRGPAQQELFKVRKLLAPWGENISVQLFSSLSKQGAEELAAVLDGWLTVPEAMTAIDK